MIRVHISNRQKTIPVDRPTIRRLVRLAGRGRWDGASVSVAVVGQEEMAAINRRFTERDADTDVLAFPLQDDNLPGENLVGEIVVCASRAELESRARGTTAEEELFLYVVHGAAHLLGYDDHSPSERRRMYAYEEDILRQVGIRSVRRK